MPKPDALRDIGNAFHVLGNEATPSEHASSATPAVQAQRDSRFPALPTRKQSLEKRRVPALTRHSPAGAEYLHQLRETVKTNSHITLMQFFGRSPPSSRDSDTLDPRKMVTVKWHSTASYVQNPQLACSPTGSCVVEIMDGKKKPLMFFDISLDQAMKILDSPTDLTGLRLNENEQALAAAIARLLDDSKFTELSPRLAASRSGNTAVRDARSAERRMRQIRKREKSLAIDAKPLISQTSLAINDLHGQQSAVVPGRESAGDEAQTQIHSSEPTGGLASVTTFARDFCARHDNVIKVGVGDMVGASPPDSSLQYDEPAVNGLNRFGLAASVVGNHEWDQGFEELLRLQNGGQRPGDSEFSDPAFAGAQFRYIAANLTSADTGKPVLPPYVIFEFDGVKIAYIGAVTTQLTELVRLQHLSGIDVLDEAQAINRYVPELEAAGVRTIVVLLHEGANAHALAGHASGQPLSGRLREIHDGLAPVLRDVLCGHTHQVHVLYADGRLFAQAGAQGKYVTQLTRVLDAHTGQTAFRFVRTHAIDAVRFPPDPEQTKFIEEGRARLKPVLERPVGSLGYALEFVERSDIEAAMMNGEYVTGETMLGNFVADAFQYATGADMAFVNLGALRSGVVPDANGKVTYGDLAKMLPYRDDLISMLLNGDQIKRLLEQQWEGRSVPKVLQISDAFTYSWDPTQPGVINPAAIRLYNGTIAPDALYRVVTTKHLANGGGGHDVFRESICRAVEMTDIAAVERYLRDLRSFYRPTLGRIARVVPGVPMSDGELEFLRTIHKLPAQEHDMILSSIVAVLLGRTRPSSNLRAIILGGQPGSGKNAIAARLKPTFDQSLGHFYTDPDIIRAYHRDFGNLARTNDKYAADIVHPDAALWAKELVDIGIKENRDLLINQTSGDPAQLVDLLRKLRRSGYRNIELHVAAVNSGVSLKRAQKRYRDQRRELGFGRAVSEQYHSNAYEGLIAGVTAAERERLADQIHIYDNEQKRVYENTLGYTLEWNKPANAVEFLKILRGSVK